jgi:F0F1-type ATP synthase membrane subunit b/b'
MNEGRAAMAEESGEELEVTEEEIAEVKEEATAEAEATTEEITEEV